MFIPFYRISVVARDILLSYFSNCTFRSTYGESSESTLPAWSRRVSRSGTYCDWDYTVWLLYSLILSLLLKAQDGFRLGIIVLRVWPHLNDIDSATSKARTI